MITYTEKGPGLQDAIRAAGLSLVQHNNQWIASDDLAVQAVIDGYTLEQCQAEIINRIDAHAKALRDQVVANVSAAEMAAWSIKQKEAALYLASSNEADAPMLGIEAFARGVPVAALAAKVLQKAQLLASLEAMIAGVCGKHSDAVKACATFADALTYDWSTGWPL